jgi:hypothetical protein
MGVFKNIKDGWINYLNYFYKGKLDPVVEKLAIDRASICKSCPSFVKSGLFTVIKTILPNGEANEHLTVDKLEGDKVQGYKCNECGCGFPANVFSPEKTCPLNKW